MDKVKQSIDAWKRADNRRTLGDLGLSRAEHNVMKRVMHETGGHGGPWFYQYSIRKGL